ncbi:MAG: TolC family protein [Desulfomonilaceae bacterium]
MNSFGPGDHVQFTAINTAKLLSTSRARPPIKAQGKRCLTLEDCRAIALANNLDLQAARVDEFAREAIKDTALTKALPHLIFSGDLNQRDNPLYSYADVLGQEGLVPTPESGTGVTNFSTGRERSTWRYFLETRWSPIDAALAYYVSKNRVNDRLKSHHQRVRVAQRMIATIDAAFFRLLSLQESLADAKQLSSNRSKNADSLRRLHNKTIVRVEHYERAEQRADEARRLLARIRNEMERQWNILASTMGISPDQCIDAGYSVTGKMRPPNFGGELCNLELIAIRNRPEAYQAGLDHLSSVNEIKRTIVRYLPRVEGFWRYTRDKDRYLYNKDWKEVGLLVQVDLLDWLSGAAESKAARITADKTYKELGAVALALTSQVRVAGLAYNDALDELRSRESSLAGSRKVLEVAHMRASGDDLSQLELEESEATVLQQKIQRLRALGEANAALAELQGALGTNYSEPIPRH